MLFTFHLPSSGSRPAPYQFQGGALGGIPAHRRGQVLPAARVDSRFKPGARDAHVELLPVHQLAAVGSVHHHQGPILRAPLAGMAGDGIGMIDRLDPAQVQVHLPAGPMQLDQGHTRLPVQGPDDAGVAVGDP